MNNLISLGLIYSYSNNTVAFAVDDNTSYKLNVMGINEFLGQNILNKIEHFISSIFQNHLNHLFVITF